MPRRGSSQVIPITTHTHTKQTNKQNTQSEVEATFSRINAHKGVLATIIVDHEGKPIRSTADANVTEQYCELIPQLATMGYPQFVALFFGPSFSCCQFVFMLVRQCRCFATSTSLC